MSRRHPGSLRREPPVEPPSAAEVSRARSAARPDRRHPAGQGGDAGAGHAGVRGRPRHLHHPGARRAVGPAARRRRRPGAGEPVGGAAAGRRAGRAPDARLGGAPPRLRRLAAACAAGAAVRRRRGGAGHRRGVLRRRVLPFRHPGLVQRSGRARRSPNRCRSRAAIWRSIANNIRAGGAGDGQRPDARRPVPRPPIRRCSPRCWARRPRCAA